MKKIFLKNSLFLLLLIAFTVACSNGGQSVAEKKVAPSNKDKDRKITKLVQYNMNQKPIITYEYFYDDQGNLVEEMITDSSGNYPRVSNKFHFYKDTLNQKTIMIAPEGDTSYVVNYIYDEKNRLTRQESLDTSVYHSIDYTYDEDGNVTRQTTFNRNQGTSRMEFTYTDADKMKEAKSYGANDQILKWNKYLYNEEDQPTDLFFFTPTGDTLYHFVYEYDERGNKIAEKEYNPNGNIYIVKSFGYDKDNNLIVEEGSKYNIYKAIYFRDDQGKLEKVKYENQYGGPDRIIYYK